MGKKVRKGSFHTQRTARKKNIIKIKIRPKK